MLIILSSNQAKRVAVHYQKGVYKNEQTNITGYGPGSFTYVL